MKVNRELGFLRKQNDSAKQVDRSCFKNDAVSVLPPDLIWENRIIFEDWCELMVVLIFKDHDNLLRKLERN